MILISHRGNLDGKNIERENSISYIEEALSNGFDVEIDIWKVSDKYMLGHDEPQYSVNLDFLKNNKLWCHAKNIDALYGMKVNDVHCFWHQEDDVTLTSKGYLWTYPNKQLTPKSIAVLPEGVIEEEIAGFCSDFIGAGVV
tara:strand:- start:2586 stop:3008 length:423 start_codon:yes stop_codon:yes gene_type:complete